MAEGESQGSTEPNEYQVAVACPRCGKEFKGDERKKMTSVAVMENHRVRGHARVI